MEWLAGETFVVACSGIAHVSQEAADSDSLPVIVEFEAEDARLSVVVGDPSRTVVLWYPPGYADVGVGSMYSVGDPDILAIPPLAERDERGGSSLTAFYMGHHTEFPYWLVVPRDLPEIAAREFCLSPTRPPERLLGGGLTTLGTRKRWRRGP